MDNFSHSWRERSEMDKDIIDFIPNRIDLNNPQIILIKDELGKLLSFSK